MKKMNPVVHFEMPVEDRKRVSEFYTKAFGWKMEEAGEEMGHYIVAKTTETDEKNMVTKPGTINGGFYEKTAEMPAMCPSVVISVPNVEEYMEKVKEAGGKILDGPMDIPTVGKYVSFEDTEGNRVSMLEPSEM